MLIQMRNSRNVVAEPRRHPTIYLRASWPARGPEGEARGASEAGTVLEVPGGPGGGRVEVAS